MHVLLSTSAHHQSIIFWPGENSLYYLHVPHTAPPQSIEAKSSKKCAAADAATDSFIYASKKGKMVAAVVVYKANSDAAKCLEMSAV